jgi:phosphoribosylanthranilate isomerase
MSRPSFIVKICGITNEEDARVAIEGGANALGFNFCKKSQRYVSPTRAREIAAAVDGDYVKVGIFVNAAEQELVEIAAQVPVDVLQLYGNDCAIPAFGSWRVWRAIAANEQTPARNDSIEAWLLDSATPQYGGSGVAFDWTLAARSPHRVIIAGGLDASNVAEAIRIASPWGVDACSHLESSPGKKDPQRVREFIQAAFAAASQQLTL